jgi:DHA2 family multidrug resistance protein-like MFS transporter
LNARTESATVPDRARTLVLVAGVANLNLSVANVALPGIGTHVDPSQTTQDLIAVGYWLGLAASVLFLGAEAYLLATLDSHERCD